MFQKRFIIVPFLILWTAGFAFAQSRTSPDKTEVSFYVKHGLPHPTGVPGFQIWVEGWEPGAEISISLIDSEGTVFEIIPAEDRVPAGPKGSIWLEVPYVGEPFTWKAGTCMLMAAGKKGVHMLQTEIPVVTPPDKKNPKWSLKFINPPAPPEVEK